MESGAGCVLVATGRIPLREPAAAAPDYLFDGLSDVDSVADLPAGHT